MAYCMIELAIGSGERFVARQLVLVNAGEADLVETGKALKRARSASSFFALQTWDDAPNPVLTLPTGAYAVVSGLTHEQLKAGDFTTAKLKEAPALLGLEMPRC